MIIRKAALNVSELVLVIRKGYDISQKILEKEKLKLKLRISGETFRSKDSKHFEVQLMHILYILKHFEAPFSVFEYLLRKCYFNQ